MLPPIPGVVVTALSSWIAERIDSLIVLVVTAPASAPASADPEVPAPRPATPIAEASISDSPKLESDTFPGPLCGGTIDIGFDELANVPNLVVGIEAPTDREPASPLVAPLTAIATPPVSALIALSSMAVKVTPPVAAVTPSVPGMKYDEQPVM